MRARACISRKTVTECRRGDENEKNEDPSAVAGGADRDRREIAPSCSRLRVLPRRCRVRGYGAGNPGRIVQVARALCALRGNKKDGGGGRASLILTVNGIGW